MTEENKIKVPDVFKGKRENEKYITVEVDDYAELLEKSNRIDEAALMLERVAFGLVLVAIGALIGVFIL
jgi:hypothetical protein